jgi:hypothetical protein
MEDPTGILASAAAALQSSLKLDERAHQHKDAGARFTEIRDGSDVLLITLRTVAQRRADERMDAVAAIAARTVELARAAPDLPNARAARQADLIGEPRPSRCDALVSPGPWLVTNTGSQSTPVEVATSHRSGDVSKARGGQGSWQSTPARIHEGDALGSTSRSSASS